MRFYIYVDVENLETNANSNSAALYRPLAVHVCIVRNDAKKEAAKVSPIFF